jgi:hypothetical protein
MPLNNDIPSTSEVSSNLPQPLPDSSAGPLIYIHHEYVGKRVGKNFGGIVYYGTVTKYDPDEKDAGKHEVIRIPWIIG